MTLNKFLDIWPYIMVPLAILIDITIVVRMAYKIGKKSITRGGIITTVISCILILLFWPAAIIPPIIYAAYKAGAKKRNTAMPGDFVPQSENGKK